MPPRDLHAEPEHNRLVLGFRRQVEAAKQAAAIGEIMLEDDRVEMKGRTIKAEPGDLRGLPVQAKGVGGAQRGSRPGDSSAWVIENETEL